MDIQAQLATLIERSVNMNDKADDILQQLKNLNSKVAHHETEIHRIKLELATASGHWSGVNKALVVFLTITGIAVGALATALWH